MSLDFKEPPAGKANYRLLHRVGLGGSSVVFAATHAVHGMVAVKRIRPNVPEVSRVREAIRHEIQMLSGLAHPNIIALYDADADHVDPYLAMTLMAGGSLRKTMNAGGNSPKEVSGRLSGVALGLSWLHRNGLVHADVKPSNILCSDTGGVRLADFGSAGPVGAAPAPYGNRVVTPSYAAPERMLGLPYDERDDVFSLGIVAYEMLTGFRPFASDPVPGLIPPARPDGLTLRAWSFLQAALEPDRTNRLSDPVALIEAIGASPDGVACHV